MNESPPNCGSNPGQLLPSSILNQLDHCCANKTFPELHRSDIDFAAARLHVYHRANHWAILIEVLGYSNQEFETDRFRLNSYLFGNCLPFEPGFINSEQVIHNGPNSRIFSDHPSGCLNPHATNLYIRNRLIPVPNNADEYKRYGIRPQFHPLLTGSELLRMLTHKEPDLVFTPVTRHRQFVPNQLLWVLSLSAWLHPDTRRAEKPSDSQSFVQLAQVAATGNINLYRPTVPPNTHWSNWTTSVSE